MEEQLTGGAAVKFYVRLVIVIGLFSGIVYWMELEPEQSRLPLSSVQLAAPSAAPASEHLETADYPAATLSGGSAAAGRATAPQPVNPGCDLAGQIAERVHASVAFCSEEGGWVRVTMQAYDLSALDDFYNEALKHGLKDIDLRQNHRLFVDGNGRMVYENTFRLRF